MYEDDPPEEPTDILGDEPNWYFDVTDVEAATDQLMGLLLDIRNPWHHEFRGNPDPLYLADPAVWHAQQEELLGQALDLLESSSCGAPDLPQPPVGTIRNLVFYPALLQRYLSRPGLRVEAADWAGMLQRCLELPAQTRCPESDRDSRQDWRRASLALLLATYDSDPAILVRDPAVPGLELPRLLQPFCRLAQPLYEQARAAGFPDPFLEGAAPYSLPWPLPHTGEFRAAFHRVRYGDAETRSAFLALLPELPPAAQAGAQAALDCD